MLIMCVSVSVMNRMDLHVDQNEQMNLQFYRIAVLWR